jgi:hypothetical protein
VRPILNQTTIYFVTFLLFDALRVTAYLDAVGGKDLTA